ncbi:hypothetical protein HDU76_002566 [Blyttiomyces sp. JEL0837]|nr:hypothetical protein HDU76_002566 [Blyttiomyces sp. JEL0837]
MKIGESNSNNITRSGLSSNGSTGSSGDGSLTNLTSAEVRKQRLLGPLPHEKDPNFTYGEPTRPSTPVARLMTDVYQREWIEEHDRKVQDKQSREKEKAKSKQTKTVTPVKVTIPKKQDQDPKTLFKMSKFQTASPKITSWRPADDKALNFQSNKMVQLSFKNSRGESQQKSGNANANVTSGGNGNESKTVQNQKGSDDVPAAAEPTPVKVEKGVRFADV